MPTKQHASLPALIGGDFPVIALQLSGSAGLLFMNVEHIRALWRKSGNKYYHAHREEIRRKLKERRKTDLAYRDRVNSHKRAWKKKRKLPSQPKPKWDKARSAAWMRVWRSSPENKLKSAAWSKRWRDANQPRIRALRIKRKAMIRGATVNPECIEQFVVRVKSKTYARCYYCKRKCRTTNIHFDHITAIIHGGMHSVENLCVSCPTCNLKKGEKAVSQLEFLAQPVLPI